MRTAQPTANRAEPPERTREALRFLALALALCALFGLIHTASPNLFGVDGYFHIKYSQILRTQGLVTEFPWLAHTIYSRNFADDHFLFHLLLVPFTFGNLRTGAKVYATLVAVAVFLCFYAILRRQNIRHPLLWTAGLLVASEPFLYRLCMARAPGVSLLFLLAGTDLILRRKDRWIGPLAFLYVWLYGGFPLIAVLSGIAFGVSLAAERRPRYTLIAACGAGIAAGLILNPYFPDNIRFLYTSYTQIELGAFPEAVQAGSEDYPYAASSAVRNALLVWAVTFGVFLFYLLRPDALGPDALILLLFSTALLCLYLNVRRFVEYWPPFAFLFAALALNPHLERFSPAGLRGPRRFALPAALALVLGAAGYDTFRELLTDQAAAADHRAYESAAAYLMEHTPRNALVFTGGWADFPLLFHYNTHNRYVVGLGPHYLYLYDPHLHSRWRRIVQGSLDRPAAAIRRHFGADHVFSLKRQRKFLKSLDADPGARIVYENDLARVYSVKEVESSRFESSKLGDGEP